MKERSEEKNKERSESYLCGVCILISIVLTPVKKIKENDKRMIRTVAGHLSLEGPGKASGTKVS